MIDCFITTKFTDNSTDNNCVSRLFVNHFEQNMTLL